MGNTYDLVSHRKMWKGVVYEKWQFNLVSNAWNTGEMENELKNREGVEILLLSNIQLYQVLKLGDIYQHIWDNWRMRVTELVDRQHEKDF